jgi:ABC-type transporter lipoprotein component MlaA
MNLIGDVKFPAFKINIIDHVKKVTKDRDVISLFESLDGYIQFRDQHHVQEALEVNDPKKKTENEITDQTQENPT